MQNQEIKLKRVTQKNIPLAIQLQEQIFPDAKSPEQIIEGVKTKNPTNYICMQGKTPIGIVGFYFDETLPDHVLLNWFGVVEAKRRQGYGKAILQQAITLAKEYNRPFLSFWTEKHHTAAIKLYKKLGFKIAKYAHKQDIADLKQLKIKNTFYLGVYSLQNQKIPHPKTISMQIAKQYKELNKFI